MTPPTPAIETGIVHLGYFRWIGAFSPGLRSAAFSNEFKNALQDRTPVASPVAYFVRASSSGSKVSCQGQKTELYSTL